jgi:ABC-2 type transport system permease protein
MKKILLILQREYMVRVQKKSFIIMTLVGPLLLTLVYAVPIYLALKEDKTRTIAVIDASGMLKGELESGRDLVFKPLNTTLDAAKRAVLEEKYYGVLYIPSNSVDNPAGIKLFSKKSVSFELENNIEQTLKSKIEDVKLLKAGIDKQVLREIDTEISINTLNLTEDEGEKDSNSGAAFIVGYAAAFLIYFSIFIYGVQVMRGILEEKTNRIVEVIISSVKPFQLMIGKITGIALVGLTQFLLWIILGTAISSAAFSILKSDSNVPQEQVDAAFKKAPALQERADAVNKVSAALSTLNVPLILGTFLFYFLGGYLIYSGLFAVAGAAADSETDTQQFMLPISVPLIISFVIAQFVIQNPDGPLAFWLSMIPLTSPIIMMVRMPFNPPVWEILLSMALLIIGFLLIAWVASRVYRIGILMYGKKVSFRELTKWVFYKG